MRISDWSSDVCSSDLAGVRRVDHGALAIADGVAPFGQIFIVAEVRRAAEMELRLAHLGREDEARVASDGIILVVEVVNIVSENADICDERPLLIPGRKADAASEGEGAGERGRLPQGE